MKRLLLALLFVLVSVGFVGAVDVDLKWDAVTGATGYKVYQSINGGVAWTLVAENVTVLTYKVLAVPENVLVLFRVGAYNASQETIRYWSGAWYDQRLKPIAAPGGNSIP